MFKLTFFVSLMAVHKRSSWEYFFGKLYPLSDMLNKVEEFSLVLFLFVFGDEEGVAEISNGMPKAPNTPTT